MMNNSKNIKTDSIGTSSILLEEFKLGPLALKNRCVMAPMTRCRTVNAAPAPSVATYYKQRAGAGLIISEATAISKNGKGFARVPGIYNDYQVEKWSKVTEAVHEAGGKIFVQLWHTGRISHSDNMDEGSQILAPSAVRVDGTIWTRDNAKAQLPIPKEMTEQDITDTIKEFGNAASNAMQAGFDGVEIHAANGFLPDQFLRPESNLRNDTYGGSTAKRAKFILDVVEEIAKVIDSQRIGLRLAPYTQFYGMKFNQTVEDTMVYLSEQLNRMNIGYLHLSRDKKHDYRVEHKIRNKFQGSLILNNEYLTDTAEQDVEEGRADLIAFGRPFISNPDLVSRIKYNHPIARANPSTFYTLGDEGYIDYPVFSEVGDVVS